MIYLRARLESRPWQFAFNNFYYHFQALCVDGHTATLHIHPLVHQCLCFTDSVSHLTTVSLCPSLLVTEKVCKVTAIAHNVYMHIHIKLAMIDHRKVLHTERCTMWTQTQHCNCVSRHQSHPNSS